MAAPVVAAAGAAVALYYASRRTTVFCGAAEDAAAAAGEAGSSAAARRAHFQGSHQAPNSWVEAMYFFAEALRYMYGETLGRWRTADLLIGLAYLARRQGQPGHHPLADLARSAPAIGQGVAGPARQAYLDEMQTIVRFMNYCLALRQRRPTLQQAIFRSLGIEPDDVLVKEARAGVLKPSYVVIRDRPLKHIVLAIRGTHSMKDMFTSLTAASKPHHVVDGSGVVLGYSHFGMLAAARWILGQVADPLRAALADNPGFRLKVIGHSLGGGTAALLTMMLREAAPELSGVTCLAIACPCCMTLELARSCAGYVTTVVNGSDLVPTISPGGADALREEVMRSAWFEALRADMRASALGRALEASLAGARSATAAASTWTSRRLASAQLGLTACYQRRAPLKRRNSDQLSRDLQEGLLPDSPRPAAEQLGGSGSAGGQPAGSPPALEASHSLPDQLLAASSPDAGQAGPSSSSSAPPAGTQGPAGPSGQVEVARDWVTLGGRQQAGHEGAAGWAGLLGGLRVRSGSQVGGASCSAPSSPVASAASPSPVTSPLQALGQRLAGWSSRASQAGRAGRSAASRSLFSRVWVQGPPQQLSSDGHERHQATPADAAAALNAAYDELTSSRNTEDDLLPTSPPRCMRMTDEDAETNEEAALLLEGQQPSLPSSAELDSDMRVVEAAVAAAELEERRETQATGQQASTDGQPGSAEPDSPTSSHRSAEAQQWMRKLYPAGRILHLVPAHLVYEDEQPAGCRPAASQQAPADPAAGVPAAAAAGGVAGSSTSGEERQRRAHRSVQQLFRYDPNFAELDGTLHIFSDDSDVEDAKSAVADPPAPPRFMLLDGVPQEAYGRIKLSSTMVQDHFIPSYKAAMESAMQLFLEQEQHLDGDLLQETTESQRQQAQLINMMV